MSRNWAVWFRSFVAIVAVWTSCRFAPHTRANDVVAPFAPGSVARTDRPQEDVSFLRREYHELTDLLRAQQEQINRQAARFEQLQDKIEAARKSRPPANVQRVPPGSAATPARLVSRVYEGDPPNQIGTDGEPLDVYPADGYEPEPVWIDVGGQYRLMFNSANFSFHPLTLDNSQQSQTFFNQRFRTWLTVRPNDNVAGHLEVEMGHILWGTNFDFPKTYARTVDDHIGIELRKGYLDYETDRLGRLRGGIQGWQDHFGQTLVSSDWDFSVGGLSWERVFPPLADMEMRFGIFSLYEGDVDAADDTVLMTLDLDWAVSETRSVGFSVYYLSDRGIYSYPTADPYDSSWDVWIGLRASTQWWSIPINGFAIYNPGERKELGGGPTFVHRGAALKLEAGPVPLGAGKLSFQTLYSTGDDNPNDNYSGEFRTIAQSFRDNFGAQGYWSYLVLTSPDGPSDVNDLGVSLQNRGFGLFTVQMKYDYPIFGRLSGLFAAGWLRAADNNFVSDANELGTELVNKFTLDFGGGLKADFGAAVLFTGDFYKASPAAAHPDNLWEAFARTQLEF